MRVVSGEERTLIALLAEKLDEVRRRQLLADLAAAEAEDAVDDRSRVIFHIGGYHRPPYRGQHPFPVDATLLDADGANISVVLYADENGRLLELEFIRNGEGDLLGPDWKTLTVT
jgi:hypothetical protein